ncbi:MAG: GWxTD domain-containing protein [Bacteroidia bacterium]|nr:GWxTD domain-containing protein [Bacteroidia bacterium]
MRFFFWKYLVFMCPFFLMSQNYSDALWNTYLFYSPENNKIKNAYAEISLSVNTTNLKKQKTSNNRYISAVKGIVQIYQDSSMLIKSDTFIVKSPPHTDSLNVPYFAYIKRYWLPLHHKYHIHFEAKDFFLNKTIAKGSKTLTTNFDEQNIIFSNTVFIDTLWKSDNKDMFYRYGYTIIPYNNNYFNEYYNRIHFFCEIYNADTVLGKESFFFVKYFVQDKDSKKIFEQNGGFKKMKASKVNVLISHINIQNIPSGNYFLVIEIRNQKNDIVQTQKIYFQRKNPVAVSKQGWNDEIFFGKTNNTDTLKMWLESLWPIANNLEKDWIINQSITKDATLMKNFMLDFWNKRAADSVSPVKLAAEHYTRLNYVMKNFKCGKIAPYYTDRGRVYLQYGEPNQRVIQLSEPGAYPYEIWQYYRIYDPSTNQFFTNRRFVFVNKGIADECYSLIHSDMKGEYNNPNWQREIIKHEIYNPNDPYQQQKLNYGNNFDKLYQNPQ